MQRCAALALVMLLALACGGEPVAEETAAAPAPEDLLEDRPHKTAVVEIADLGSIRIELFDEIAPDTVANFEKLAAKGFYDGTTFHRVIPGFMIQGGDPWTKDADPRNDGRGGPGYNIKGEVSALPHLRGMVAMANRGHPDSAGSQFFIVHQDSPHLDGKYTIFGRVVEGLEVMDAVTTLEIDAYGRYGPRDRPYPVHARIGSIRVEAPPSA